MLSQRILAGRELKYRIIWLVILRYVAVAGLLLAALATGWLPGIRVAPRPILFCAGALLGYNLVIHTLANRIRFRDWFRAGYVLATIQILVDLVVLTILVHCTGGILNPFVFFYVFHGIIAAILLSRRAAFLQATTAVAMLTALAILEETGVLPRPRVLPFLPAEMGGELVAALLISVAVALYLAVYMTTSLSRELRDREERAMAANERLMEQDRLKSEYVRLVAHDLKGPLGGITSTLRVVLDGYAGEIPDSARTFVERAAARAEGLIGMIKEMLDLSNIRPHEELERSSWELLDLIRSVMAEVKGDASQRGVEFVERMPDEPVIVYGNRGVFHQFLRNLIGNAVKYNVDGGRVYVGVRPRGMRLRIMVADTGIGIPEDALPRVFEEFYRAPNARKSSREGTGLGLAFVRRLVESMRGEITVESPWTPDPEAEPVGTRFVVRIPWSSLVEDTAGSRAGGFRENGPG